MADLRRPAPLRYRPPGARRLAIIVVLVTSMIITLLGRLYYVQLLDPHKPVQTAGQLHEGIIVVPAPRGLIVDTHGRPLVQNTSAQEITVDRETLQGLLDNGDAVLAKLADLLGTTAAQLAREITPCSSTVSQPCWTGEPYQPVPVTSSASERAVLSIG